MFKTSTAVGILTYLIFAPCVRAQEIPEMPRPQKEHQWLERLVGEWDTEAEIFMEPGKPPLKTTGTESARMVGGFWMLANVRGDFVGSPFEAVMTLGYDSKSKKYVGTWVDSMMDYMWNYEGTVDAAGNKLTLTTKGPCPKRPGELATMQEVIEFKDDNHRTFTSSMREADGSWTKMMTVTYRRKK